VTSFRSFLLSTAQAGPRRRLPFFSFFLFSSSRVVFLLEPFSPRCAVALDRGDQGVKNAAWPLRFFSFFLSFFFSDSFFSFLCFDGHGEIIWWAEADAEANVSLPLFFSRNFFFPPSPPPSCSRLDISGESVRFARLFFSSSPLVASFFLKKGPASSSFPPVDSLFYALWTATIKRVPEPAGRLRPLLLPFFSSVGLFFFPLTLRARARLRPFPPLPFPMFFQVKSGKFGEVSRATFPFFSFLSLGRTGC